MDVTTRSTRSPLLISVFGTYIEGYFARHFTALRLLLPQLPRLAPDRPLVVALNHPSWWDPIVGMLLHRTYFSDRTGFAPMDAEAMGRWSFFRKMGFYPVRRGMADAAETFVATTLDILRQPGSILWITPQGRFGDVRVRPVTLAPGLGLVLEAVPEAIVLPLALEYPFWDARLPEALAAFGISMTAAEARKGGLEAALAATQDRLAVAAIGRDPTRFSTLRQGRGGVAPAWDAWQRLRGLRP